jgi:hypothetical protein
MAISASTLSRRNSRHGRIYRCCVQRSCSDHGTYHTRCRQTTIIRKIKKTTNLFTLMINTIKNRSVSRLGETGFFPRLLVTFVTGTETLGTEVEGIAKRLVNACEFVVAGHEDLGSGSVISSARRSLIEDPTGVDEVESKYGDRIPVQRPSNMPVGAWRRKWASSTSW